MPPMNEHMCTSLLIFFFSPSNYGPSPFVVCRLATRVELIMPPLGIWDQLPVKVVRDHGDYEGDISDSVTYPSSGKGS